MTNAYDDSYAYLLGDFGANYTIEGVVQINSGAVGDTHEVELLLRVSDDSNSYRAYEVDFWRTGPVQIGRWNGPWGDVITLPDVAIPWTPTVALKTGDRIKARIIGNTIEAWINDVLKAKAVDSALTTGQPGIGFFIRPGGANNIVTLTSVSATRN